MRFSDLKDILDNLYLKYKRKFSSKDPVWVLHKFQDVRDIEIVGLLTSAYAYGRVEQINLFIDKLLANTGGKPYEFTTNFQKRKDKKFLKGLNYRFNTERDIINLFEAIRVNLVKHGSLKNLFISGYSDEHSNITKAMTNFSSSLSLKNKKGNKYYHYLVANPVNNSTCK